MEMSNQLQERFDNASNLTDFYTDYYYDYEYEEPYCFGPHCMYISGVILTSEVVIGIIGNILSLIVWTKGKECCKLACSTYFQLLAICDVFALICARWSFESITNRQLDYSAIKCAVTKFLTFFAPQLSIWLLVCLSYERFFSLAFPFSFMPSGAKCRAKITILILIFVLAVVNGCSFPLCYGYKIRGLGFWTQLSDMWMMTVIPFTLIVTSNILILVQLCCLSRNTNVVSKKQHTKRISVFTKLTISSSLLLMVSVCPLLVDRLDKYYGIYNYDTKYLVLIIALTWSTLYANNCFNFLVYCLSTPTFRSDIKHFVHKIKTCFRNDTAIIVAEL